MPFRTRKWRGLPGLSSRCRVLLDDVPDGFVDIYCPFAEPSLKVLYLLAFGVPRGCPVGGKGVGRALSAARQVASYPGSCCAADQGSEPTGFGAGRMAIVFWSTTQPGRHLERSQWALFMASRSQPGSPIAQSLSRLMSPVSCHWAVLDGAVRI